MYPYEVVHERCGHVAALAKRELVAGDVLMAEDFTHVDGTPATAGEAMRCDACGWYMGTADFRFNQRSVE